VKYDDGILLCHCRTDVPANQETAMNATRSRIMQAALLFSALLLFVAVVPSRAQINPGRRGPRRNARMQMNRAADAAIRQLVENYSTAFNNHDARAVAMLYAENADFTNMFGASQHGRPAIEKTYAGLFSGRLKDSHRTDTPKTVRLLNPRLAVVDANWEMSGTLAANGKPNPVRKGMLTWVVANRNGNWEILVFHEFDFPGQ
jgi:uncharacterized protein (TIGR02246 family)